MEEIINYIAHPEDVFPGLFPIWEAIRLIFIIISATLFVLIIYVVRASEYMTVRFEERFEEFTRAKPAHKIKLKINWRETLKNAREGNEADRKLAVIEADDAVNDALGQMGYKGENLWDKLGDLNAEIVLNLEELKNAHKMKRDLVYDPNKGLSAEDAMELISVYERTFKDLRIF